jgi:hypothetical protein
MTPSPFAALHSGLLVRKGAALPSPAGTRAGPETAFDPFSIARRDASDADAAPPAPPHPGPCDAHREAAEEDGDIGFELSDGQDRRLRLAAAKLDTTREQLLSEAIDNLLRHLGKTELSSCSCYRALADSD